MKFRPVRFSYQKKDGSIRNAIGTLNKDFLNSILGPSDKEQIFNPEVFVYYDLEQHGFRRFNTTQLNSISFMDGDGEILKNANLYYGGY